MRPGQLLLSLFEGCLREEVQPDRCGVRSRRALCEGMRRGSGRAQHFRLFTSIDIRLSGALSVTIFLSCVFSHSSSRSRFADSHAAQLGLPAVKRQLRAVELAAHVGKRRSRLSFGQFRLIYFSVNRLPFTGSSPSRNPNRQPDPL